MFVPNLMKCPQLEANGNNTKTWCPRPRPIKTLFILHLFSSFFPQSQMRTAQYITLQPLQPLTSGWSNDLESNSDWFPTCMFHEGLDFLHLIIFYRYNFQDTVSGPLVKTDQSYWKKILNKTVMLTTFTGWCCIDIKKDLLGKVVP